MIIFFNKSDGVIIGAIGGRINSPEELNMWIGEKGVTEKISVQWKQTKENTFEPDCNQKEVFINIDGNLSSVYRYKVDVETMMLVGSFDNN